MTKTPAIRTDRRLSVEAVKRVILADSLESVAGLASELGISRKSVWDIRTGRTYRDVLPEVERTGFINRHGGCASCMHYTARRGRSPDQAAKCELAIPEFVEEAHAFGGKPGMLGLECSYFQPKEP